MKPAPPEGQPRSDRDGISRLEFARRFGIGLNTVDRCIQQGQLKVLRFGRRVVVPFTELQRLSEGLAGAA